MPLTDPSIVNPFRMSKARLRAAPFLMHAIVALSAQHLGTEVVNPDLVLDGKDHWHTAMRQYSMAVVGQGDVVLLETLSSLVHYQVR